MSRDNKFKKGLSGNPSGRPKGTRSWKTLIAEELGEVVAVKENGKMVDLTMAEVLVKALVKRCLSGDPASIDFLFNAVIDDDIEHLVFSINMGKDLRNHVAKPNQTITHLS